MTYIFSFPHVTTINLSGGWRENSGKVWNCTQHGSHFQWVQEGTGRIATGLAVPKVNSPEITIFITFDNSVHWKLVPSQDHNSLSGPSDVFTRVYPIMSEVVYGAYRENSGKVWTVTAASSSCFSLFNQQDGRTADAHFSKDPMTGVYTIYITFHNPSGDHLLRATTTNLHSIPLSNNDVFAKVQ